MRKPKYSVIIPVYNAEPFLKRCLDSLLCYRGEDLEVIALDDGSTDGSLNVLRSYTDSRLKIVEKENEGAFKTWKEGVRLAEGEYIIFVDSDDYVAEGLFEELNRIFASGDYDLVQFGWTIFDGKKFKPEPNPLADLSEGSVRGIRLEQYKEKYFLPKDSKDMAGFWRVRWGKVFRADKLRNLLPRLMESIKMYEDDSAMVPYCLEIDSLYYFPRAMYYYWIGRKGSVCNSEEKYSEYLEDANALSAYFAKPEFAFPPEILENYYFYYHLDVFYSMRLRQSKIRFRFGFWKTSVFSEF